MQRNKVVFDNQAALTAALNSPVRHEMREAFHRFPSFTGPITHFPMATTTVMPKADNQHARRSANPGPARHGSRRAGDQHAVGSRGACPVRGAHPPHGAAGRSGGGDANAASPGPAATCGCASTDRPGRDRFRCWHSSTAAASCCAAWTRMTACAATCVPAPAASWSRWIIVWRPSTSIPPASTTACSRRAGSRNTPPNWTAMSRRLAVAATVPAAILRRRRRCASATKAARA